MLCSADGCIDSRRWRHTVTSDTSTGADTPWAGRISTLPTTRGYTIVSYCLLVLAGSRFEERIPMSRKYQDIQPGNYCSEVQRPSRMPKWSSWFDCRCEWNSPHGRNGIVEDPVIRASSTIVCRVPVVVGLPRVLLIAEGSRFESQMGLITSKSGLLILLRRS